MILIILLFNLIILGIVKFLVSSMDTCHKFDVPHIDLKDENNLSSNKRIRVTNNSTFLSDK